MSQGIDLGRRLTLDEIDFLRSRGFRFVARYYTGNDADPKNLSTTEIAGLLSRGFGIVPVFQTAGNYPGYFTNAQGLQDGAAARAQALRFGQPLGTPIVFAVDFDVVDPGPQLVDYFNGVYAGIDGAYLIGIYGEYDVIEFARANFVAIGFFWQTAAWSAARVSPFADVYQQGQPTLRPGLTVDLNVARTEIPWRLAA